MSEMVERVAMALFAGNWQFEQSWSELPPGDGGVRRYYRNLASEAIAAMREPTAEMLGAGSKIGDGRFHSSILHWQAMIDEALK